MCLLETRHATAVAQGKHRQHLVASHHALLRGSSKAYTAAQRQVRLCIHGELSWALKLTPATVKDWATLIGAFRYPGLISDTTGQSKVMASNMVPSSELTRSARSGRPCPRAALSRTVVTEVHAVVEARADANHADCVLSTSKKFRPLIVR